MFLKILLNPRMLEGQKRIETLNKMTLREMPWLLLDHSLKVQLQRCHHQNHNSDINSHPRQIFRRSQGPYRATVV